MLLSHLSVSRMLVLVSLASVWSQTNGKVTFQDDSPSADHIEPRVNADEAERRLFFNRTRQGKDLFDWIGLGTGQNIDPYLAKTNQACLTGELAECFKSQALNSFAEFFDKPEYNLNDNIKVIRMPKRVVQEVYRQPYEYSSTPRSGESDWDQLVKFAMRKAEKFVKTVALEIAVPSEVAGDDNTYAPRFLDEIADEIDTLENKKDTLFSRNRLRRLLIPMLIILKLFKLKLLLFLPLIFGLASFKKFLGFMAIVIPGLIGFFKLYKPTLHSYQPPYYTQSGIGYPHYKENVPHGYETISDYNPNGYHAKPDDKVTFAQDLAYQGYRDYYQS